MESNERNSYDREEDNTNGSTRRKKRVSITQEKLEIAVNIYKSGGNTSVIANALGVSRRTAQRIVRSIEEEKDLKRSKSGPKTKDDSGLRAEIEAIIASDNSLTAVGIIERLPADMKCSASTISRTMKSMNYTRKRLKPIVASRNSEQVIHERHVYSLHLTNIADDQLIFLDETGFNLHTCAGFGYAPVGETAWIHVPTQRGRNVSVIAAISVSGIVAHGTTVGAYNTEKMVDWCRESLLPALAGRRVVFIMDNARFHHAQAVSAVLTTNGSVVKFLPPYSPQLNPIEQVFATVKERYRRCSPRPLNQEQMLTSIKQVIAGLRHSNLEGYFREMRRWLTLAQQRQPFL
jgi:transposase